jgi:hypothetical protein
MTESQREQNRGIEVTQEDSTNRVARSIKALSKFIEEFEGFRSKTGADKKPKQEAMVELKINNMVT